MIKFQNREMDILVKFSKISWLYLVGSMNLQKNLMICMHSVFRAFNGLTLSLNPIWMNTTIQIRKNLKIIIQIKIE